VGLFLCSHDLQAPVLSVSSWQSIAHLHMKYFTHFISWKYTFLNAKIKLQFKYIRNLENFLTLFYLTIPMPSLLIGIQTKVTGLLGIVLMQMIC
jgi:hypothetical protein